MSETTSNQIRLKDKGFWRMLHNPAEVLTFKDVLDNLRNYAVVGSLYVFSKLALLNEASSSWVKFAAIVLIVVAVVTALMCLAQSWVSGQKAVYAFLSPIVKNNNQLTHIERLKILVLMGIPIVIIVVFVNAANAAIFQLAGSCK